MYMYNETGNFNCCQSDMRHVMTKPAFAICKQQGRRSACASTQSDQAFVIRCLDSIIPVLATAEISRPKLISVDKQAGLSHTWLNPPKTGFLMTWLI